jgi:hypothetical protein
MSWINGWQGAQLQQPVVMLQGTDFWLVWNPVNGAQASVMGTGAGAQPYRGSFDGGQTWNGPYQSLQWKLRIWTGTPGHYETFGAGCGAGRQAAPELGWNQVPTIGASFDVRIARASVSSFAFLTIGDSNSSWQGQNLPYDLAPQGAPGCSVLASVAAAIFVPTDPAGSASLSVSIPSNTALFGLQFYDQWFAFLAGGNPLGFVVSNGGAGTVGM